MHEQVSRTFKITFTGNTRDFFKIWVYNVALTILTFGLYGAWAKIKNKKYFYRHTRVDGYAFDYIASPWLFFLNYLIVMIFFVLYMFMSTYPIYHNNLIFPLFLFLVILPTLIFNNLSISINSSIYRNIKFRFHGTLLESYQLFLWAFLIPLTMGIYYPYWVYLRKRWLFENTKIGNNYFDFKGKIKFFYGVYINVFFVLAITLLFLHFLFGYHSLYTFNISNEQVDFFLMGLSACFLAIFYFIAQEYLYARITNYCLNKCEIGEIKIKCRLKARVLIYLKLTRILSLIFTVGLLSPWLSVKRIKYILSCITIERIRLDIKGGTKFLPMTTLIPDPEGHSETQVLGALGRVIE